MLNKLCSLFFLAALTACTLGPTKVYESQQLNNRDLVKASANPLIIDDNTVVIDARSSFDFTMTHVSQSINLSWEDFLDSKMNKSTFLARDLFKVTRRLALLGISPNKKIVVVGNGTKAEGDDGRLAWTLLYLGIPHVQVVGLEHFKNQLVNTEAPPLKNESPWKPKLIESLIASSEEVREIVKNPGQGKDRVFILDVRSAKEYFNKSDKNIPAYPDINAINIEWKEFFNEEGRPNLKLLAQLQGLGMTNESKIIVVSNRGVRSGAVVASLVAMGFKQAANCIGGLQDLFAQQKN